MFKEMGALMQLMGNRAKIQEELQKFQAQTAQITAEGTAGAGYVMVKVNGKLDVLSCRIAAEAMRPDEREMLEDLIVAATNQAFGKVRGLVAEEAAKMASNLGLPPGMLGGGFPGLGG